MRPRFTLSSVTPEGADRIAHLATAIAAQMNQPLSGPGGAAPAMDMRMSGGGTMDVNVERGLIKSSEQHITIDATMGRPADGTAPVPAMRMHGTVTISQSTEP
jgi:hypothetical protein